MSDALTEQGLTEQGGAAAEDLGRRYDVPADAVAALHAAIRRGGGRQAQFSHAALGGMGQWSRGGGIMIGDMFNQSLKARVEQLCNVLAQRVDNEGLFTADPKGSEGWWPRDCGRPNSTGRQNEQAYACFPDERRLAIRDADGVRLYDTGDHRISGVSQQQGGGRDLTFSSQHGTVRLSDLRQVDDPPAVQAPEPNAHQHERAPAAAARVSPAAGTGDDALALLERLHDLHRKGILTAEEFAAKKSDLLARL